MLQQCMDEVQKGYTIDDVFVQITGEVGGGKHTGAPSTMPASQEKFITSSATAACCIFAGGVEWWAAAAQGQLMVWTLYGLLTRATL
jgi:hypothetical protein